MSAHDRIDSMTTKLAAEDTLGAWEDLQVVLTDPTGIDDAHKIALADALLNPIWRTKPPRRPVTDPDLDSGPVVPE